MSQAPAQSQDSKIYSIEYQRSLLKLFCTNLKFAQNYGILVKDEYFESQSMRILFSIAKNYVYTYEREIDQPDLFVKLDEYALSRGLGHEILSDIQSECKVTYSTAVKSEQAITDVLIKFARRQELLKALVESVDILEKDGQIETILPKIDSAISVGSGVDEGYSLKDLAGIPAIYQLKFNPNVLVSTGIPGLDKALDGGVAPGELHVICAPPKSGKSRILSYFGSSALRQKKNVFHISLEISKEDLAMMYTTSISGLEKKELFTPEGGDVLERKLAYYQGNGSSLYINHWTEGTVTTHTIRSWIARIRSKTGIKPDLIIVDYDDCLLPTSGKTGEMYDDAGAVYSDLIQLGAYFSCPVWTAAQPQRDAWALPNEGHLIQAFHLAHSARKAHKTYSITTMNFPEGSHQGILFVDMVRRGESKVKIRVERDLSRCRFAEI